MHCIGFVTTSFPRFAGDTAGSFVFEMGKALRKLDIEIEVAVPEPPDNADWGPSPWLDGVRVLPVPYARPRAYQRLFFGGGVPDNVASAPWTAALIPAAAASMAHTVARALPRWDAVVSHWLVPSAPIVAAAAGLARKTSVRHLAVAHSGDVHLLSRAPFRPLARLLPGCADELGFVSETLRQQFLSLLGENAERVAPKTRLLPMGINLEAVQTNKPRDMLRRDLEIHGFAVLFLGRMVPIKGLDVLIEGLSGRADFELIAAGDGPLRIQMQALAESRGVRARFLGAVNEARRSDLFAACDALVLPSITLPSRRTEGLPLVILEAMGAGLPVIAADTGSVSEIVRHECTGLLFEEKNSEDLARCLAVMRNNKPLRDSMRRQAASLVAARDWGRLAREYAMRLLPNAAT